MHSSAQLEHFKQNVDDHALKNGGLQRVVANDGCIAPLNTHNGLPCIKMRPYSFMKPFQDIIIRWRLPKRMKNYLILERIYFIAVMVKAGHFMLNRLVKNWDYIQIHISILEH